MQTINIGVVIVNYNSGKYIEQALKALDKQTYKPAEVIIYDNASSEELPVFACSFKLKIVKSGHNLGFAAGCNRGVELLDESISWIALLNPDAYPEPTWLEEMVKAIKLYPLYAFFGSKLISFENPELLDGMGDAYHLSGKAWRINHKKTANVKDEFKEIFSPCAAAALYRRDAFKQAQGFDESFFCYYEDIDLAFRLRLLGYHCCYVPTAVVAHVGSVTTKRHSDFYTYHGHRNLVWTYLKNMPSLLLTLSLPMHILLNLFSILVFAYRGQAKILLKAKLHALRSLKEVLKQRRIIQKSRKASTRSILKFMHKGLPW